MSDHDDTEDNHQHEHVGLNTQDEAERTCRYRCVGRAGAVALARPVSIVGLLAAGEEGGDDVAGVAVEVVAGSVVSGGGSRVGVSGRDLHVSQRHPGVEGGGDEAVPQRMR